MHLAKVEPIIMNTALIACLVLALFASNAECAITAWTEPGISGATGGSATFSTSPVAEGTAFTITVVATTDLATVTYAITSQTPDTAWATLTSAGVLSVAAGVLNFESPGPSYVVTITATDVDSGGINPTTGVAVCTLAVTNVNEAPAFSGASLTATIADAAVADTTLGTYAATDQDVGDTVTYSIFSGNTNTDFTIVTSTGVITVATGKTLSMATTPSYSLVLYAVDSNVSPLTGSTTVSVTVGSSGAAAITACFITVIIGIFINVMK